jgi:serine protease Do
MLTCTLQAATLDSSVMAKVQAATFELVAAKPTTDPLTYEKPLPLDQLPYAQRNDKYTSLATAFVIGHNRYVTAAHSLIMLMGGNLWGSVELRDAQGHVYPIDKIEKFSLARDFAVFSLKGDPAPAAFPVDANPALNQTVYAVGNAEGQGVIARDGLYTSTTPEDENGRWKWIRFSAAADFGSGGGPLLDKDGNVIGVIVKKSPNENLNYALPINEVINAPDNAADLDSRVPYQLPMFDTTISNECKGQLALPSSYDAFDTAFNQWKNACIDAQHAALLSEEADNLFPKGAGSDLFLHAGPPTRTFPSLMVLTGASQWRFLPVTGGTKKNPLPHNGFIINGFAKNTLFEHIGRPDNVPASQYYSDPKLLIDTLATQGYIERNVGTDNVKVTSLGEPVQAVSYTDMWGRHWRQYAWPMPFVNWYVMVSALPVPDGYVALIKFIPASMKYQHMLELREMSNYLFVAYDGSLAQWKDFLQQTQLLPDAFKNIHVAFDYNQSFSYTSNRIHFGFTPQLQKIAPESSMTLTFGYLKDGDKVVWDVSDVRVKPDAHTQSRINIRRNIPPTDDLDGKYKEDWVKYTLSQHPYDGILSQHNDVAEIATVINPHSSPQPQVLYSAFYGVEGSQTQDEMKSKLDMLVNGFKVNE